MRELNPQVPGEYLSRRSPRSLAPKSQDAIAENYRLHQILVHGYRGITYIDSDGVEQNPTIRLVSHDVEDNEFLAVNQVTIRSADVERRFDIVLYLNGMPVAIIELKQAGAEQADIASAHAQLQTYLREFPMAFRFVRAHDHQRRHHRSLRHAVHSAQPLLAVERRRRRQPARQPATSIDGDTWASSSSTSSTASSTRSGSCSCSATSWPSTRAPTVYAKRIAKPHQYFAVTKAVGTTVDAVESNGKAGVVWHTQGSGKSMEMELYAHLVARQPKLKNPTIVVVTDRNELDSQLFETFNRSPAAAPRSPVKVHDARAAARRAAPTASPAASTSRRCRSSGSPRPRTRAGLDHPLLTDRRNIIVIVDEAHRSHYDDLDGYARHIRDALPNADVHRLHRHADLVRRPQHPRSLRRRTSTSTT